MTPAERALCVIRVWRCPGYTAYGNQYRCHPDEEPGGYDVGFIGMVLNQKPMTFDDVNTYVHYLRKMVETTIKGTADPFNPEHAQQFPFTEESVLADPYPGLQKPLRALASAEGRLVWTPRRRGFVVAGADVRMRREDVFWCEQNDLVRREPDTDRQTGDRLLTDRGRRLVSTPAPQS